MGKVDMNGQPIVRSVASRARLMDRGQAGRHGGDRKSSSNTLLLENGQSRDIAAAYVGMSGEQAARCGFFVVRMVAKKLGENWERNAQKLFGQTKKDLDLYLSP